MTTKINPTKANTTDHLSGKTITAVTVDFAVNGTDFTSSAEMGPLGSVQAAIATMTQEATPIIITKLRSDGSNAGQVFDMVFEGEFGTDTYDGTNSEAFAAYLQTVLRLLTSVGPGPVNLNSATVVAATAASF
jgi:hypothetical protein|tara:strand:- start:1165 stop:1563 length:399 start_codon:yes stop_codon:yes gene_type:complete